MRVLVLLACFSAAIFATAQSTDVGKQVYSASENSVFLVYVNDASGSPDALGSAFLVKPGILITNAHVAEAGDPVLAVGPVRIPLKVLRVDKTHDLAEMSVELALTSKPLSLSEEPVKPGEQIFAIGNPEGLEKTISQGIVSGLRKRDGSDLIQISSPISHGSSGGPILNSKGEVIGVAVAFLEQGQNLNFAVPVEYVKTLLEAKYQSATAIDVTKGLAHAEELMDKIDQSQYSDDADSDYQKLTSDLVNTVRTIVNSTAAPETLERVACLGTNSFDLSDLGIAAARKLVKQKPNTENQALLAYVLLDRSENAKIAADFSEAGSERQKEALAEREKFLTEAGTTASLTVQSAHGNALLLADFVLGETKSFQGDSTNAIALNSRVAAGVHPNVCEKDLAQTAMQNLIRENADANKPEEAERWFKEYSARYTPSSFDWDAEGDRREDMSDYSVAATAYENAARGSRYYTYDYCYAAVSHYFQEPSDGDGVLADGKLCVDGSAKNTSKNLEGHYNTQLPYVYNYMANILDSRGVYEPALGYIKESIRAKPDYALAMNTEANIYSDLQRFSECEAVEKEAIRLSDGKYPFMQFVLGTCYFSQENWAMAGNSFRIAAVADKTNAASAFNLALSLGRQGLIDDEKIWLREALKRNPSAELHAKIESALGR